MSPRKTDILEVVDWVLKNPDQCPSRAPTFCGQNVAQSPLLLLAILGRPGPLADKLLQHIEDNRPDLLPEAYSILND